MKAGNLGRALALVALLGLFAGCGATLTSQENARYVGEVDDVLNYDTPPVLVVTVRPEYPDMARQIGVHGRVVLKVLVLENGQIARIEILESPSPILGDQAITAVRKSSFMPATKDGSPCPSTMVIPFIFDRDDAYVRDRAVLDVERSYAPEDVGHAELPERPGPDLTPGK
ncbi:MAG: energy transducer TonB [Candidatus Eisenbacteria bacterium]